MSVGKTCMQQVGMSEEYAPCGPVAWFTQHTPSGVVALLGIVLPGQPVIESNHDRVLFP